MPPEGYKFDHAKYTYQNDELDSQYSEDGAKLRKLYPEISSWPSWACCVAYMEFGEALEFCRNPYNNEPRKDEFIAFLYAEQELGKNGYFIRDDGTRFTHYDINKLDQVWAKYDDDNKNG